MAHRHSEAVGNTPQRPTTPEDTQQDSANAWAVPAAPTSEPEAPTDHTTSQQAIEFDLGMLPVRERFQFWHDHGSLIYRPLNETKNSEDELQVKANIRQLGDISMGFMTASEQHYERTEQMIRKDQADQWMLVLLTSGSAQWQGRRQHITIQPGDIVLLDAQNACKSSWSPHSQIFINIPREKLSAPGGHAQGSTLLPASDPRARILRQHLLFLWETLPSCNEDTARQLGAGLTALTSEYFADRRLRLKDEGSEANAALLTNSIQSWIESHLHLQDLDAEAISKSFHISRSVLYQLFKPWNGVRSYIQTRRLEIARELLEDPVLMDISIGKIRTRLGFRSDAAFSRGFRTRWGIAPADLRRTTRQRLNDAPAIQAREIEPGENASKERLAQACRRYYSAISSKPSQQ